MAGHAAETMDEYYDLKSKNTTQTVIDALNNKYDMVSEVENLEASSISDQREIDFSKYKETAEEDRRNRLSKQKAELKDQEMPTVYWNRFMKVAYRLSPTWLKSRTTMSPKAFKKLTLELLLQEYDLQDSLCNMLLGDSFKFLQYVGRCDMKKVKKNKRVSKRDEDILSQVLEWICKEVNSLLKC